MKYIIKNCPNYWYINRAVPECGLTYKVSGFKGETETCKYCKDIDDCLIKRIVEKCKNYKEDCKIKGNCLDERLCSSCFLGGANELGEWILDDLEIEEVKE